jgi:orotidine-5'-phosphate decarboxylase
VAGAVLADLAERNRAAADREGRAGRLGSFGAVVGATIGRTDEDLAIGGPLLAPGLGAQGATAADLPGVFGRSLPQVLPSMSRGISRSGPDAAALRDRVQACQRDLRAVMAAV